MYYNKQVVPGKPNTWNSCVFFSHCNKYQSYVNNVNVLCRSPMMRLQIGTAPSAPVNGLCYRKYLNLCLNTLPVSEQSAEIKPHLIMTESF